MAEVEMQELREAIRAMGDTLEERAQRIGISPRQLQRIIKSPSRQVVKLMRAGVLKVQKPAA